MFENFGARKGKSHFLILDGNRLLLAVGEILVGRAWRHVGVAVVGDQRVGTWFGWSFLFHWDGGLLDERWLPFLDELLLLHLIDELALYFFIWCWFLMYIFLHINLSEPKRFWLSLIWKILHHRLISLVITYIHIKILNFNSPIFWRNAILYVHLILMVAKIYILSSCEIENFFWFWVFHSKIVTSYYNLVKFIGVDKHFSFGFSQ